MKKLGSVLLCSLLVASAVACNRTSAQVGEDSAPPTAAAASLDRGPASPAESSLLPVPVQPIHPISFSTATTPIPSLSVGTWGGKGIELEITSAGASIVFPCSGGGSINGPVTLNSSGDFNTLGLWDIGLGTIIGGIGCIGTNCPAICQPENEVIHFQGTVSGNSMRLWTAGPSYTNCDLVSATTVIQPVAFSDPGTLGSYALEFGQPATGMNEACPAAQ